MMLFWKIRYLDRSSRNFGDRHLYLNTNSLDPIARAAVELVAENRSRTTERDILKYKHLFAEETPESLGNPNDYDRFMTVGPSEYFEDEAGTEINHDEIARIVTGSPTARSIPSGARQHDIDFMLSENDPIPLAQVTLTPEEVRLLGYFVRDLREMQESAFMKDGPGTLKWSANPTVETAVTDEEIRSFVTIFRRLYMTGAHDPASFVKAVPVFVAALGDSSYGKWVDGTAKEYQQHLGSVPDSRPFVAQGTYTFTTKRLIDVFLYTQYAHQPDAKRQRQFNECLAELNGRHGLLTWLFLAEIWKVSLKIGNAGRVIARWFNRYCEHHAISPDVLSSLRDHHEGLGAAEKAEDRASRLFQEKVEQLANELWEQAGRPAGGSQEFLTTARAQLAARLQL